MKIVCFILATVAAAVSAVCCTAEISGSGQTGAGSSFGTGSTPGGSFGGAGSSGGGGSGGNAGSGGAPIPTTPPLAGMIVTPHLTRLSHPQWANSVKDLLKLTDIRDIDQAVTGDAVVGFDNDAASLFVSETLRSDLADAAVKLADRVTGDAAALARLVPANAPPTPSEKPRHSSPPSDCGPIGVP